MCPKGIDSPFLKVSFFSLVFLLSQFLFVGCASLLPPERRVYPKNPVSLPKGMDVHDWIQTKRVQFPDRLQSHSPWAATYKIVYYQNKKTFLGSYISCSAYLRQTDRNAFEIIEMASMINYSDHNKSVGRYNKGGDLGPMSEKERTEILLPCIEEFLEPSGTKE
ncbi:hypothetical protein EHQ30_09225 [Leptospira brenneri]|uniref:Lipoprotein n=1 Tax=Leptospira brenneri TaxID=2023182 RepID=A0A5F1ZCI5_9LEPT|nr:hypothetical protein EHQ30_09225 [Leptospira brenneri]